MLARSSRRSVLAGLCAALALVFAAPNAIAGPLPQRLAVTRRLEKWRCTNQDCEPYIYDPSLGAEHINDEENPVPPGVAFQELPDDWVCPVCADLKDMFQPLGEWVEVTIEV